MSIEPALFDRAESKCELCSSADNLQAYSVPPVDMPTVDTSVLACDTCRSQMDVPEQMDVNHWRCLNDSAWSQVPAVQVLAWRMLNRLSEEGWPQGLLEMMYLDDDILVWAKVTGEDADEEQILHRDSNGHQLTNGDNVVLTKDLDVKGSSMVAKRGAAVRGISLVRDNPEQIEGRVNGQQIVILTKFVKKS